MGMTKLQVIDCTGGGTGAIGWPEAGGSGQSRDVAGDVALHPAGQGGAMDHDQRGMVSAEWAVGIIAAIGIAGVLIAVVTNGAVQDALLKFVLQLIHSFSGFMVKN